MAEPSIINMSINEVRAADEPDPFADPAEARRRAMDLLARREHSRDELVKKLKAAGFEQNATFDAIDALRKEGLQSDRRFVESFVSSRVRQGKGPIRIRADLAQRGVREPCIGSALTNADVDWCALASEIREKKFGREVPADFKEKARQMRFLQYRGFESDQIRAAVGGDVE